MHRLSFRTFALAAMIATNAFGSEAQEVSVASLPEFSDPYHETLAFSKDGRFLVVASFRWTQRYRDRASCRTCDHRHALCGSRVVRRAAQQG